MSAPVPIDLFPLRSVLFPGGVLLLKVFEARYLDLVGRCLREERPFGVVCLAEGREVGRQLVRFENEGVLAHIENVDAEGPNLLQVRCRGGSRFAVAGGVRQQPDGLWAAEVVLQPDDATAIPEPDLTPAVRALAQVIASLRSHGTLPFSEPFRLDDAGWVANRWCEILPVPLTAKQKLMALPDPQARLRLVHDYLKGQGIVQ